MPRFTAAGQRLRRARAAAQAARAGGRPVAEGEEAAEAEQAQSMRAGLDRRDFLRVSALGAVVAGGVVGRETPVASARASGRVTAPRIVVVGAGLAGLTAAYEITKRTGWVPKVYEASPRVGGRVWTLRGAAGNQYLERGGGGINTRDRTLPRLARELGLTPLVDTWLNYPSAPAMFAFGGKTYTWAQLRPGVRAIENFAWNIWRDIGYVPSRRHHNATALKWDHRSVVDLIDASPHHTSTPAGAYVQSWFGGEYGGRASQASALHYVMEQGAYPGGGWDERYCIPGGNDTLATALAAALVPGSLVHDRLLVALVRRRDRTYALTFASSGGPTQTVVADRVVLALPPTTLREVDLTRSGISAPHLTEISRHRLGTGAKLNLQFSGQPWAWAGHSGDATSDTSVQMAWSSQFQSTNPANLVILDNHGGHFSASTPAHGPVPARVLARTLVDLDRWYPSASATSLAATSSLDYWPNDPLARGTWSFYEVGGFTGYGGLSRQREGTLHFAGETTAPFVEHSTMCGAVTSGMRVAREIASY